LLNICEYGGFSDYTKKMKDSQATMGNLESVVTTPRGTHY